ELGAGADGEMRGGLGVADQHHVVLDPALAADHREIAPHRAIGEKLVAAEEPAEDLRHAVGGLLLVEALQAGSLEGPRVGLENPGRAAYLILIGMRDERTPLRLLEDEGEGVERFGRAHPGELVGADVNLGFEVIDMLLAKAAVDAVRENDEIGIGKACLVVDVDFELQPNTELARPLLQDQQELPSRAAAKAVAADAVHRPAEMHGDVIPISEFLGDTAIARRVIFFEIIEGRIGKYHAEAEGVVSTIALIDRDLGLRPLLFQQDRGVKAGRAAANDRDLHARLRAVGSGDILNLKHLVTSPRLGLGAQFPWKTGFTLLEKATKARSKSAVVMHSACATASASIASSTDIAHSIASMRLVMVLAKVGPSATCRANSCASGSTRSGVTTRPKKPQRSPSSAVMKRPV